LSSAGDVRVNWFPVLKNGVILKSGDVVSVSGMGRLKVIKKENCENFQLSYN
jgi:RNA-binding protein YlmH